MPSVLESDSETVLVKEMDAESVKVLGLDEVPVLVMVPETEKARASVEAMVVSSAVAKAASAAEAKVVFEVEACSALLVEQPLLELEMAELFSFVDRVCRDLQNVFPLFFYMSFLFSVLLDFE